MSPRIVSSALIIAFAFVACQRNDNMQQEDASDSIAISDSKAPVEGPTDWQEFELIFSFKDKAISQKLGVKFPKVDAVEFRLFDEDQLCNSEFWGLAINRVAHTEFDGDKDENGVQYLADEFVLDDSVTIVIIRIAETRDKARIKFTDKTNSDDECLPAPGLLLRAEDVR